MTPQREPDVPQSSGETPLERSSVHELLNDLYAVQLGLKAIEGELSAELPEHARETFQMVYAAVDRISAKLKEQTTRPS